MIIHEFPGLMWHALRHRNKRTFALGLIIGAPGVCWVLIVCILMGIEWMLVLFLSTHQLGWRNGPRCWPS